MSEIPSQLYEISIWYKSKEDSEELLDLLRNNKRLMDKIVNVDCSTHVPVQSHLLDALDEQLAKEAK